MWPSLGWKSSYETGIWLVKHSEISSALTYTHAYKCRGAKRKLIARSGPSQSYHSSLIYAHKLTSKIVCPEKLICILSVINFSSLVNKLVILDQKVPSFSMTYISPIKHCINIYNTIIVWCCFQFGKSVVLKYTYCIDFCLIFCKE